MNRDFKKRILVVDDDPHIAEGLKLNLSLQGYDVAVAASGPAALQSWKDWNPHLIVLDIMLPGLDGLTVLQRIRLLDARIPVLILSAKGGAEDKVKGFSCGVDDYLAKPFNLDEFLLRVERLLTRSSWGGEENGIEQPEDNVAKAYCFGSNRIDFETLTAQTARGPLTLTEQEALLLKLFIANKGKPLSRKALLEVGWGYSALTTSRTVDNFIVRLRKYFEEDPQNPAYFKSLRSVGYLFDHP